MRLPAPTPRAAPPRDGVRPRASRAVVVAAAALAACGTKVQPLGCVEAADCPSGSYCAAGACVADALPVAHIAVPQAVASHRVVVLDGSASRDPDRGDLLTEYAWSITQTAGTACDAAPAQGGGATFDTVFPCGGEYDVELAVKDRFGNRSAPAREHVHVVASLDAPQVASTGAAVTVSHRCSGTPLACEAYDTAAQSARLPLSVTASDVEDQDRLAFSWSYAPPDGVDPRTVTVTFEPDAHTRSPTVRIATDGARIVGDWKFTVRVSDSDGLVTPATQIVTVGWNAPPAVRLAATVVSVPHRYLGGAYVARGALSAAVSDPDGDRLGAALTLDESTPSGCSFQLVDPTALAAPSPSATFELSCTTPQALIGATSRALRLRVTDPNGGEAIAAAPLVVENAPPVLVWSGAAADAASSTLSLPHRTEACGATSCYVAEGDVPLTAFDPDGDPLSPVALSAAGLDAASSLDVSQQHFTLRTATSAPLSFRRGDGTSPVVLQATVRDPWTASAASDPHALVHLRIANRPPSLARLDPGVGHRYSDALRAYLVEADVARFDDPDGDGAVAIDHPPLARTSVLPAGGFAHVTLTVPYDWRSGALPDLSPVVGAHALASLTPRDAWDAGAPASASFTVGNAPPVVPGGTVHVESCSCDPNLYTGATGLWASGSGLFDPGVVDPDGDPVLVQATSLGFGSIAHGTVALGPAPLAVETGIRTDPSTMLVRIDAYDGRAWSSGTYTLELSCSRAGAACP